VTVFTQEKRLNYQTTQKRENIQYSHIYANVLVTFSEQAGKTYPEELMAFIYKDTKKLTPRKKIKLTEAVVQNIICSDKDHKKRYDVMVPRCMTQIDNEADVLAIRKSGFCDEFEIKLTRADFFNDRKKIIQYRRPDFDVKQDIDWFMNPEDLAPYQKFKLEALGNGEMVVNNFWYVLKEGIASVDDLPGYAGLISVDQTGLLKVVKHPDRLHSRKLSFEQRYKFVSYLNERFWRYRNQLEK